VLLALAMIAAASFLLFGTEVFGARPFRVISYNVQNLFDGTDDGHEYREFRAANGYTRERYWSRLEQLARVVTTLSRRAPDAILLIELEHVGVAVELANHFFTASYEITSGEQGVTTTSAALLTRETPSRVTIHAAAEFVVIPGESPRRTWRGRDAISVTLPGSGYSIYAAHWKSQSGGERETEAYRLAEARLAESVIRRNESEPTLLVGDLNENLSEYEDHDGAYPTALMPVTAGVVEGDGVRFVDEPRRPEQGTSEEPRAPLLARSLWHTSNAPGTYFYRGRWERLDHAFLVPATTEVTGRILVGAGDRLVDAEGVPRRYDPRTGYGLSDHLPLLIELSRSRAR
jgi:endonuclease/exonuclease/phosphatase family metal-dependent hydrolase